MTATNLIRIVDTHALIWFLESNPRLGATARRILADPASDLILPAIALAEACWIVKAGRTAIASVHDLLAAIDGDARFTLLPLDRQVLDIALTLTSIGEMHDRQIVATALLLQKQGHDIALLTRDANIRKSGLVSIMW